MACAMASPKMVLTVIFLSGIICLTGCDSPPEPIEKKPSPEVSAAQKILFVNSYHKGYPWSDAILASVIEHLELRPQAEDLWENDVYRLKIFYMDSKRKPDELSKETAARQAMQLIATWQPELMITSDDNAVKYLAVPLLKEKKLPIVFTGVNWDAADYHLPREMATGMIEVQLIDQIIANLQPYAKGNNVCFLKGADFSTNKEADAFERHFGLSLKRLFVSDFTEWSQAYRQAQQDCSMLLVGNPVSIEGWDDAAARALTEVETLVPTGAWDDWMQGYVLLTFSTVPDEQGEWAATAAREILAGESPAEIEVTRNRKAKIYRNMAMAKQLGIVFPMEFIRRSLAVEQGVSQ
jgi:ABC-type uncharacterized transport system substrate-binding protein